MQQRWLHYYWVSEVFFAGTLYFLCATSTAAELGIGGTFLSGCASFLLFCGVVYIAFIPTLFLKRMRRPSARLVKSVEEARHEPPTFEAFDITRDGATLHAQIARADTHESKGGGKVILLCSPLGQCGPDVYAPLMTYYGSSVTFLTWDYRGFFRAGKPANPRELSIPEHARDAVEVIKAAGFESADMVIGHSMGTAVALELALLYPERVKGLVLVNGFHGNVFQTAGQPLFRVPFVGDLFAVFVDYIVRNPSVVENIGVGFVHFIYSMWWPLYTKLFGRSKLLASVRGPNYFPDFLHSYVGGLCDSASSMDSYLRMFQELNAHSVYHLLPRIAQPVLLISGYLDTVTPPMQSIEMARRIPHAVHYCDPLSSHCSLLESPEWCLAEIITFAKGCLLWSSKAPGAEDEKTKRD